MNSDKVLVILPYIKCEAQGNELYYALLSWNRHCLFPYHLVIIGDEPDSIPQECKEHVEVIRCPRVHADRFEGQYVPHIDTANKLWVARSWFPSTNDFVLMMDDIYSLCDFSLNDIRTVRFKRPEIPGNAYAENGFLRDGFRDHLMLEADGFSSVDYTCHIPRYLNWHRLGTVFSHYHCLTESHNYVNLYYNMFQPKEKYQVEELIDGKKHVCYPVTSVKSRQEIARQSKDSIWLFNSVDGYSKDIEEFLQERYQ